MTVHTVNFVDIPHNWKRRFCCLFVSWAVRPSRRKIRVKPFILVAFAIALIVPTHKGLAADKLSQVFVRDAFQENKTQMRMAELAQDKSENAELKAFSDTLVVDCTLANKQAEELAGQIGVDIPADLNVNQKATVERLSKLSGAAFDRAFVREIIAELKANMPRFENQAKKADDPVGEYARQILPTLKGHLEEAQKLRPGLKGESSWLSSFAPRKQGEHAHASSKKWQSSGEGRSANDACARHRDPQKPIVIGRISRIVSINTSSLIPNRRDTAPDGTITVSGPSPTAKKSGTEDGKKMNCPLLFTNDPISSFR
jgi:putative membrane protein